MICAPALPSSISLDADPVFVERRERRFDASPRKVNVPETLCLPVKSVHKVSVLVTVFVRLWNTVDPVIVWFAPSSVTVPVEVNAPAFTQDPESVMPYAFPVRIPP